MNEELEAKVMTKEMYQELLTYLNAKNLPSTAVNDHYQDESVTLQSIPNVSKKP